VNPDGSMLPEGDGLHYGKAHRSEKPSPLGQGFCQNLSPAPLIHAPGRGGAGLDRSHGNDIDFIKSALEKNLDKDHLLGRQSQGIKLNIANIRIF
jgi:hypothetical protein